LVGISVNHITTYKMQARYMDMVKAAYGIDTSNNAHIQSMIFALDMIGLKILINKGLFAPDKSFNSDKTELVALHEISMTMLIFDAGYSVFSFIKASGQGLVSFSRAKEIQRTQMGNQFYDDHWLPYRYKLNLCETMFVKSNRGITFPEIGRYNDFMEEFYSPLIKPIAASSGCPDWSTLPEFGFVILRHVKDASTNRFWQRAYAQVRLFHSEPIIILDDNSNSAFLTPLEMVDTQIISSEFPGRGELLPYYYFHKLRPWKRMIFIHDSVFLNSRINVEAVKEIKFLWHFNNSLARPHEMPSFLSQLNHPEELLQLYLQEDSSWYGCFGGMSIIHWQFLDDLVQKYNLFTLLDTIQTRGSRMNWERILGLICCHTKLDLATNPSVFGYYEQLLSPNADYSYENYLARGQHDVISKVFTGR